MIFRHDFMGSQTKENDERLAKLMEFRHLTCAPGSEPCLATSHAWVRVGEILGCKLVRGH